MQSQRKSSGSKRQKIFVEDTLATWLAIPEEWLVANKEGRRSKTKSAIRPALATKSSLMQIESSN
jgi:hypothetical protein